MTLKATITAPSDANTGDTVTFTANATGQDTRKTLNGGVFTVGFPIPYEEIKLRKNGDEEINAVSLDAEGDPLITAYNDNFLYDSNGELLFDSNSELLEALDE